MSNCQSQSYNRNYPVSASDGGLVEKSVTLNTAREYAPNDHIGWH